MTSDRRTGIRSSVLGVALLFAAGAGMHEGLAEPVASPPETPARAANGPRIEVEQREVDLGEVVRGNDIQGQFTVRNAGSAILEIVKVKPG